MPPKKKREEEPVEAEPAEEPVTAPSGEPQILLEWEYLDRPDYKRGWMWYVMTLVIGAGLLIYSLASANFLFALVIVMVGLVVYVGTLAKPVKQTFAVTDAGIVVGRAFYPFRDIERFWFCYEPPTIKSLYLEVQGLTRARLLVDLVDVDPNRVREVLGQFVFEDINDVDEPPSDTISRLLKI